MVVVVAVVVVVVVVVGPWQVTFTAGTWDVFLRNGQAVDSTDIEVYSPATVYLKTLYLGSSMLGTGTIKVTGTLNLITPVSTNMEVQVRGSGRFTIDVSWNGHLDVADK